MTDEAYHREVGLYSEIGERRTHMDCHHCGKSFIALIDFSLDGNHIIECAHCGHEHYRKIQKGVVTEERWGSANGDKLNAHRPRRVWKHNSLPMATTSASAFIRDRWLEKMR